MPRRSLLPRSPANSHAIKTYSKGAPFYNAFLGSWAAVSARSLLAYSSDRLVGSSRRQDQENREGRAQSNNFRGLHVAKGRARPSFPDGTDPLALNSRLSTPLCETKRTDFRPRLGHKSTAQEYPAIANRQKAGRDGGTNG